MTPPRFAAEAARALARGLAAAVVVILLTRWIGVRLQPGGVLGLCLLAAVLSRLVRVVREPLPPERLASERPGGPPPDRPFERVDRIEDRLSWGSRTTHHFDAGVRPVFARIAADRLRRRYGVDLARQPDQARHLLGEELWRLVAAQEPAGDGRPSTTGMRPPPAGAELEALVRRLEML